MQSSTPQESLRGKGRAGFSSELGQLGLDITAGELLVSWIPLKSLEIWIT